MKITQHFLIVCYLLLGFQFIAQGQQQAIKKNQWGVRLGLMSGSAYSDLKPMIGATFLTGKHQFYAGIMTNILDRRGDKPKSPLLGSYLSYQFFPFKTRNCFNAYAYFSNDIGRYSYSINTTFVTSDDFTLVKGTLNEGYFVVTNTLGIGLETRFKKHVYGNLSAGGSGYYQRYSHEVLFTETTDKIAPDLSIDNTFKFGLELKVGVGYRF